MADGGPLSNSRMPGRTRQVSGNQAPPAVSAVPDENGGNRSLNGTGTIREDRERVAKESLRSDAVNSWRRPLVAPTPPDKKDEVTSPANGRTAASSASLAQAPLPKVFSPATSERSVC